MSDQEQEVPFNVDVLIWAYQNGYFPMSDSVDGDVSWYRPTERAIFELDNFHIPKRLKRDMKLLDYTVKFNVNFRRIMTYCRDLRQDTWISDEMIDVYEELHSMGNAHSVEIYIDDELAGGLYGVSFAGVFCGESMFHLKKNCSKIALCELVNHMKNQGMSLLDSQYVNDYLEQFNIQLIGDAEYQVRLSKALRQKVSFI